MNSDPEKPVAPAAEVPAPAAPPVEEAGAGPQFISRRQGDRSLFNLALLAVVSLLLYFAYKSNHDDIFHLYQGLLILTLACVPALQWAYRGDSSFPLMEAFLLTTFNTYAVPLLTGHQSLGLYDSSVITTSANVVIVYQLAAIVAYNLTRGFPKTTPFWTQEIISEQFSKFLPYGLTATTLYTLLSLFFHDTVFGLLPRETEGVMRAAFFGLGIICTFITTRRWGMGTLANHERNYLIGNLLIQFVLLGSTLYLIGIISNVVLALLGYVSGSRRLPVLPMVLIFSLIAVLHNGKSRMREIYWAGSTSKQVRLAELPGFYSEWISYGLENSSEQKQKSSTKLLERTSLFHIICLVVDWTPSRQDYLYGETYKYIPGQFIPRFFWPGKPQAHVATSILSIRYGLQNEEDTKNTTIAFGMLSEAYANFGFLGAALLGIVFGAFFKKISYWTRYSPMLSYGGLILVLLMAWSFQSELTMSIWLSSLFQGCVAVLGLPLIFRSFLS